jgi:hypothetical protein
MSTRTTSIRVLAVLAALGCGGKAARGPGAGAAGTSGTAGAGTGAGAAGDARPTGAAGEAGGGGAAGSAGGAGTRGAAGAAGGPGGAGKAGAAGTAGAAATPGVGGAGGGSSSACNAPSLVWKTGSKTNFTSYPAPGSQECIQYNGCMYEGEFAGCNQTETLAWVMSHNIVAVFPDFATLKLHDLCLKSSTGRTIVVTVLDTCGNSDCNGCCTQNQGTADELIDVESFTDARWGVPDGRIEWADLGLTTGSGCQ